MLGGLSVSKTLENSDGSFQPREERSKIESLATRAYVREAQNVLFMCPPGIGKSHLAVALGVTAIKNGFTAAATGSARSTGCSSSPLGSQ
jgi:DNA replication protein DnaC